jgi:hypothetical protein
MVRVHEHFACFIPTGRAINPVTRTNWEGIGVKPEVEVRAGDALRTAHVAAVKQLLERTTDEERRDLLRGALELAEKTPSDPEEDFARPGARRTTGR